MKLSAENVNSVFMNCLFKEGDDTSVYKVVEGVVIKAGFHPERLKEAEESIFDMLNDLPDEFKKGGGGGMSFLNMCNDKHGNQWAEHQTMDKLVCLGIAVGKMSFLMPREMWKVLPGGMPYVLID